MESQIGAEKHSGEIGRLDLDPNKPDPRLSDAPEFDALHMIRLCAPEQINRKMLGEEVIDAKLEAGRERQHLRLRIGIIRWRLAKPIGRARFESIDPLGRLVL